MTNKDKIDEDYKNFTLDIEHAVERDLAQIREESNALKRKADEVANAVESSIDTSEVKTAQKKVNS